MEKIFKKSLNTPDETRSFDKGKVELVTIGKVTFGRAVFQPGWKWSESVKPIVKTKSCTAGHTQYVISGTLHIVMDNGTEFDVSEGDTMVIPPGHDAWVVGDKPFVAIDVTGMTRYAQPRKSTEK